MTDTTSINLVSKNVGAKPRLLLLSSKQSRTRLKSGDFPPDQTETKDDDSSQSNGVLNKKADVSTMLSSNSVRTGLQFSTKSPASENNTQGPADTHEPSTRKQIEPDSNNASSRQKQTFQDPTGDQPERRGFDKLTVSKEDLIALLSMLKSELQSKELALASMKLEQLKRLINPVEISRSSLSTTYIKLQDRLKAKEQLNDGIRKEKGPINSSASEQTIDEKRSQNQSSNQIDTNNKFKGNENDHNDECDEETIEILSTLLELLDRHPLLALPRDSIYCLDYNCDEMSTKNYLNLKIQHLENLIEQHRKFRHHVKERLKRSEQRSLDLTIKLELEQKFRTDNERSVYRNNGRAILLEHIHQLKEDLEKEKASKHAIVMTLLNELLDERERNETLTDKVIGLEERLRTATKSQEQASSAPIATNQQSVCKPRVPAKPAQLFFASISRNQK